ncbi:BRCT domain-containing protein [Streptomyces sp. NPDC052236]|uniref:BRCT domain-containing protein n=1 Tax=Streptomyces sp. NPDC052236 TaxID=3365686 RepID=UPI0037D72906
MDLRGKTVVLMGRFHGLSQAEAKAGLEALGARVTRTVSSKTDLIFRSHDVAGHKIGAASQLGIPIYDWNTLRAMLKQAAEASAGVEPGADEPSSFLDHASLASAADPDSLLGVLGEADWSAFVSERDLLPLRNRLQELERTHGVTEVHRFATEGIRSLGSTRLQHPFRHFTEIDHYAISPCGCYLATGSWCGDDYHRGGALQIWEIASGRCVNVLDRIQGGVGWPGYDNTIQWSADSTRVGLAYHTNHVGVFDPFGGATHTYPIASAQVTNGASRPPGWALAPDGRRAFIQSASPCAVKGCVVPLEAGDLLWMPEDAPPSHQYLLTEELPTEFGEQEDDDAGLWLEGVSWSRDGSRLLAYDAKRRQTFAIDMTTKQMRWLTKEQRQEAGVWHGASAVGGSGRVRVSVGSTGVTFHRTDTGAVLSDFEFLREPPGPRCVEHEYAFDDHPVNFALDDDTWCAAFEEGVVIAPSDRREDLEAVLAWSVDRRFAWPVQWGGLEIVPDAKAAAELLGDRGLGWYVQEYVGQQARDAEASAQAKGDGSWPPPNTATLDELFSAARDSVSDLSSNSNYHVCEHLRHAARLRARQGEVGGALEMLDAIPETDQRVAASADVAMILARAGRTDEAGVFFADVEAGAEAALGPYNVADVASSVGGAHHAMGDTAAADVWFARARDAIEPEANAWQNRLTIIWALTECGREDEARVLWARGEEWRKSPSTSYSVPWLLYLLGTGRLDMAEGFLKDWAPDWDWWMSPVIGILADLGRTDLLRLGPPDVPELIVESRYENALRIAEKRTRRTLPATPSEADLAALAEAHAELLKTPRAKRERPTELLIEQAAECGHLSAVLDLLGKLPSPRDFNGRPSSAFSALWRSATGQDVAPW